MSTFDYSPDTVSYPSDLPKLPTLAGYNPISFDPETNQNVYGDYTSWLFRPLDFLGHIPRSMLHGVLSGEWQPFINHWKVWKSVDEPSYISGTKLLADLGIDSKGSKVDLPFIGKFDLAGFGAEVLLDPLTYLSFGGSTIAKNIAAKTLTATSKALSGWDFMARKALDHLGRADALTKEFGEESAELFIEGTRGDNGIFKRLDSIANGMPEQEIKNALNEVAPDLAQRKDFVGQFQKDVNLAAEDVNLARYSKTNGDMVMARKYYKDAAGKVLQYTNLEDVYNLMDDGVRSGQASLDKMVNPFNKLGSQVGSREWQALNGFRPLLRVGAPFTTGITPFVESQAKVAGLLFDNELMRGWRKAWASAWSASDDPIRTLLARQKRSMEAIIGRAGADMMEGFVDNAKQMYGLNEDEIKFTLNLDGALGMSISKLANMDSASAEKAVTGLMSTHIQKLGFTDVEQYISFSGLERGEALRQLAKSARRQELPEMVKYIAKENGIAVDDVKVNNIIDAAYNLQKRIGQHTEWLKKQGYNPGEPVLNAQTIKLIQDRLDTIKAAEDAHTQVTAEEILKINTASRTAGEAQFGKAFDEAQRIDQEFTNLSDELKTEVEKKVDENIKIAKESKKNVPVPEEALDPLKQLETPAYTREIQKAKQEGKVFTAPDGSQYRAGVYNNYSNASQISDVISNNPSAYTSAETMQKVFAIPTKEEAAILVMNGRIKGMERDLIDKSITEDFFKTKWGIGKDVAPNEIAKFKEDMIKYAEMNKVSIEKIARKAHKVDLELMPEPRNIEIDPIARGNIAMEKLVASAEPCQAMNPKTGIYETPVAPMPNIDLALKMSYYKKAINLLPQESPLRLAIPLPEGELSPLAYSQKLYEDIFSKDIEKFAQFLSSQQRTLERADMLYNRFGQKIADTLQEWKNFKKKYEIISASAVSPVDRQAAIRALTESTVENIVERKKAEIIQSLTEGTPAPTGLQKGEMTELRKLELEKRKGELGLKELQSEKLRLEMLKSCAETQPYIPHIYSRELLGLFEKAKSGTNGTMAAMMRDPFEMARKWRRIDGMAESILTINENLRRMLKPALACPAELGDVEKFGNMIDDKVRQQIQGLPAGMTADDVRDIYKVYETTPVDQQEAFFATMAKTYGVDAKIIANVIEGDPTHVISGGWANPKLSNTFDAMPKEVQSFFEKIGFKKVVGDTTPVGYERVPIPGLQDRIVKAEFAPAFNGYLSQKYLLNQLAPDGFIIKAFSDNPKENMRYFMQKLDELSKKHGANLIETNPRVALSTFAAIRGEVQVTQEYYKTMFNIFGKHRDLTPPENYRPVNIPGMSMFKDIYFPPSVAESIEREHAIMYSPEAMNLFRATANKINKSLKFLATRLWPRYYIRNFISDNWLSMLGGGLDFEAGGHSRYIADQLYKTYTKYNKAIRAGNLPEADGILEGLKGQTIRTKTGESLSRYDIYNEVMANGVLQTGDIMGGYGGLRETYLQDMVKMAKQEDTLAQNAIKTQIKTKRMLNSAMVRLESNARIGHYLVRRIKGDSPAQAAQSVFTFLFDYGDVGWADRFAESFTWFWRWNRNNTQLFANLMMEKPALIESLVRTIDYADRSKEPVNQDMIDQFNPGSGLRIKDDKVFVLQYYIPQTQFFDWVRGFAAGKTRGAESPLTWAARQPLQLLKGGASIVFDLMSPVPKAALELAQNRSFFTDKPIENFPGEQKDFMNAYLPVFSDPMFQHVLSYVTPISAAQRAAKKMGRGEEGFMESVVKEIAGFRTRSPRPDITGNYKLAELQKKAQMVSGKMKEAQRIGDTRMAHQFYNELQETIQRLKVLKSEIDDYAKKAGLQ